jgi:predicted HicB family RNase H-like nuclease
MKKETKGQEEMRGAKKINVIGFKQFNVRLSSELYKALAHESVESDRSLQDLVAEAIKEFLRKKGSPFLKGNE